MIMHEYPGYTVRRIENEMTWEMIGLLLKKISRRRGVKETGLDLTGAIDIEEAAEIPGFGIKKVVKNVSGRRPANKNTGSK